MMAAPRAFGRVRSKGDPASMTSTSLAGRFVKRAAIDQVRRLRSRVYRGERLDGQTITHFILEFLEGAVRQAFIDR